MQIGPELRLFLNLLGVSRELANVVYRVYMGIIFPYSLLRTSKRNNVLLYQGPGVVLETMQFSWNLTVRATLKL